MLYEDEQPGGRKYDVLERLADPKLCARHDYVREMQPGELTLQFVQEHGLTQPLVLHSCDGLGMRLPPRGFSVQDVKKHVGARRVLDVMDCNTQESLTMSLGAWVRYYQSAQRERTLNVISLEFSRTSMDSLVEPPSVVRQLDWVELVWPKNLKDQQTDPTNDITKMMYPKVQKYCLMSIGGCYTDFHLDFGGTSVWYHVFEGEKTFVLVPPTPQNYQAFHKWQKSGQQDAIFFPDTVLACEVVQLKTGDTFILPSGWIHAVYTQQDSLVFGGNFLHTSNIPAQLKVKEMEDMLKVPEKFRYPFYSRVHWYVLVAYSNRLEELGLGTKGEELHTDGEKLIGSDMTSPPQYKGHLTGGPLEVMSSSKPYFSRSEYEGLLHLLQRIRTDGLFTDDIPSCVHTVAELMDQLEAQLSSLELCSTTFSSKPNGVGVITPSWERQAKTLTSPRCMAKTSPSTFTSPPLQSVKDKLCTSLSPSSHVVRSRRRRCLVCVACQMPPCGSCKHCLDSPKFGGPGHLKQSCVHRKCQQLHQECVTMNDEPHASTVPPEEAAGGEMEDTSYTVLIETVMNPHQCICQEEGNPLISSPEEAYPLSARLKVEHQLDAYSEDSYKPSAKDTYRSLTEDNSVESKDRDLSHIISTDSSPPNKKAALLACGLEEY